MTKDRLFKSILLVGISSLIIFNDCENLLTEITDGGRPEDDVDDVDVAL